MSKKFKLKPAEDRASKNINLRVTLATYNEIEVRAKSHNLSITAYMKRTALGRPIHTSNTTELIRELMNLCKQQRELYKFDQRNEHKYLEIMQAIVDAIIVIPLRINNKKNDG